MSRSYKQEARSISRHDMSADRIIARRDDPLIEVLLRKLLKIDAIPPIRNRRHR